MSRATKFLKKFNEISVNWKLANASYSEDTFVDLSSSELAKIKKHIGNKIKVLDSPENLLDATKFLKGSTKKVGDTFTLGTIDLKGNQVNTAVYQDASPLAFYIGA